MFQDFDAALVVVLAVVALAVFLFEFGLLRSAYGEEERQKRILKKRLTELRESAKQQRDTSLLKADSGLSGLDQFLSHVPFLSSIRPLIDHAGKSVKSWVVLLVMVSLASLVAWLVWAYTRIPALAGVGALVAMFIPILVLKAQASKRLDLFESQLPDAVDIIIRALRAGHPFDSALKVVAEEMPAPISEEFAVVSVQISYGVPLAIALENMAKRIPSRQFKSLVTAVVVQRETGGNLAEILRNISNVIRGGIKFQRKLRTLSAEGRMSILTLASVPIVLGVLMNIIYPGHSKILFTNPIGQNLLVMSAVVYVVGFLWAKMIVKIDV